MRALKVQRVVNYRDGIHFVQLYDGRLLLLHCWDGEKAHLDGVEETCPLCRQGPVIPRAGIYSPREWSVELEEPLPEE